MTDSYSPSDTRLASRRAINLQPKHPVVVTLVLALLALTLGTLPSSNTSAAETSSCVTFSIDGNFGGKKTYSIDLCSATQTSPLGTYWPQPMPFQRPHDTCEQAIASVQNSNTDAVIGLREVPDSRVIAGNTIRFRFELEGEAVIFIRSVTWNAITSTQQSQRDTWEQIIIGHEINHANLSANVFAQVVRDILGPDLTYEVRGRNIAVAEQQAKAYISAVSFFAQGIYRQINIDYDAQSRNGLNDPATTGDPTTDIQEYVQCGSLALESLGGESLKTLQAQSSTFGFLASGEDGYEPMQPITWEFSGAANGLSPDNSTSLTSRLAGYPRESGAFGVTIKATDADGATGELVVGLTVDPVTIEPRLPVGVVDEAYDGDFSLTGPDGPVSLGEIWSFSSEPTASGPPPPWLSLDANSGSVSGTPDEEETYDFTVEATIQTDADPIVISANVSIDVRDRDIRLIRQTHVVSALAVARGALGNVIDGHSTVVESFDADETLQSTRTINANGSLTVQNIDARGITPTVEGQSASASSGATSSSANSALNFSGSETGSVMTLTGTGYTATATGQAEEGFAANSDAGASSVVFFTVTRPATISVSWSCDMAFSMEDATTLENVIPPDAECGAVHILTNMTGEFSFHASVGAGGNVIDGDSFGDGRSGGFNIEVDASGGPVS